MRILEIFADGRGDVSNALNRIPHASGNTTMGNIINYILYLAGILAVVMIIVSGVQMVTSAGDAGAVQKAKNTLTYSIIGLVVTILAYAIVNFVVTKIG